MNPLNIYELIKLSLWNEGHPTVGEAEFEEMKSQAIAALPAGVLSSLDLASDLAMQWRRYILQQVAYYVHCKHVQTHLPLVLPYVILKGTSAAQYYPHPEYRTMGDIDIMTLREDYERACGIMLRSGCRETTSPGDLVDGRHRSFMHQGVTVEIHAYFASMNDAQKAKAFDDLIIDGINASHVLPDLINGLVLIEHVNQHLEHGIGLRQIIDWMMFVDRCIRDDNWSEFLSMAEKTGLDRLAIVCTRMCEIYLGLQRHMWCADADPTLCEQLMDYVMACGNFGNKMTSDEAVSENVMAHVSTPKAFFSLLQKRGLENWRAAKKCSFLIPFAWIYQVFRYASRGIKRDSAVSKLKEEYATAKKRKKMFDALGVKIRTRGLAVYRNGKYVKE